MWYLQLGTCRALGHAHSRLGALCVEVAQPLQQGAPLSAVHAHLPHDIIEDGVVGAY